MNRAACQGAHVFHGLTAGGHETVAAGHTAYGIHRPAARRDLKIRRRAKAEVLSISDLPSAKNKMGLTKGSLLPTITLSASSKTIAAGQRRGAIHSSAACRDLKEGRRATIAVLSRIDLPSAGNKTGSATVSVLSIIPLSAPLRTIAAGHSCLVIQRCSARRDLEIGRRAKLDVLPIDRLPSARNKTGPTTALMLPSLSCRPRQPITL